jgi:hypothetical protein
VISENDPLHFAHTGHAKTMLVTSSFRS